MAWHQQTGELEKTCLVHGEEENVCVISKKLQNTQVVIPALHQKLYTIRAYVIGVMTDQHQQVVLQMEQ